MKKQYQLTAAEAHTMGLAAFDLGLSVTIRSRAAGAIPPFEATVRGPTNFPDLLATHIYLFGHK
ncbi:hypothetical protein [Variibacter gotjawalensis]|jgi:hypothetical protein|uniref:hypothetical protein n=1 Tax=Variibacter gotjawalensis TaxID=1333996 RepID=UPI00102AE283|nr:hypothetical protein [Variibacter gotjawalensis]NIK47690.1 hypothetical protein [Variibacter gotjawalensis]